MCRATFWETKTIKHDLTSCQIQVAKYGYRTQWIPHKSPAVVAINCEWSDIWKTQQYLSCTSNNRLRYDVMYKCSGEVTGRRVSLLLKYDYQTTIMHGKSGHKSQCRRYKRGSKSWKALNFYKGKEEAAERYEVNWTAGWLFYISDCFVL